jgi:hypothetical protein
MCFVARFVDTLKKADVISFFVEAGRVPIFCSYSTVLCRMVWYPVVVRRTVGTYVFDRIVRVSRGSYVPGTVRYSKFQYYSLHYLAGSNVK